MVVLAFVSPSVAQVIVGAGYVGMFSVYVRKKEAAKRGLLLWRSNVGAMKTIDGRLTRFGLANDSQRMNQNTKSSDLIGIRPTVIGPEHFGQTKPQVVGIQGVIMKERRNNFWT